MSNIQEVCVNLDNYGELLGSLSPTFGLKANSGLPDNSIKIVSPESKRAVIEELAKLGGMLSTLNPRDVSIWGK